ncbi:SAVED domain-containing protein [Xanthomonas sp. 3058]|uniref:SAVED domain-containing protein n=1 Tax=Xanthomonas sp. 3058 TaxID=3035314 RepID=UPI001612EDAF|nr:SAVED domain-containing protein [Xanthomonas sp. 3058]MBB5865439.1 hypothetical protein [Xanthomonas sp. 3058]
MSWNTKAQEWVSTLVKWVTRRRHASRALLMAGAPIVLATLAGGWTVGVRGSAGALHFLGFVTTSDGLPRLWLIIALISGLTLLALGTWMSLSDWLSARRAAGRSAVIAMELRGLVDTSDHPLLKSVPRELIGQRLDALIDVRESVQAGAIDHALRKILGIPDLIQRLRGSRELGQVQLVVAGVLQVPLLFLAGVLLDDEGRLTPLDWHRATSAWRRLDEPDDGERFATNGIDELSAGSSHVVLSVSASYRTDHSAIQTTFGGVPVVSLSLSNPLPDTLWSGAKQDALAAQFVSTVASLGNRGVRRVSLILAAPSSLVIRIGRAYDRRNMPEIACYQYERTSAPAYPWSVLIEPAGTRIVLTTHDGFVR